ncbi:hypothetical protein [Streptomyces sp. H27-H5]|uniref:hypothetical protein n=1 Tax=Streptomyces sp. H27-H5 TaxID=2996460 RepID=UPI00226FD90C|nr:hypothetical protein [Streptomyces sp. H27-H5]MCY0962726.1 hypothetical protein [Streptomyces sp. H27-H5]
MDAATPAALRASSSPTGRTRSPVTPPTRRLMESTGPPVTCTPLDAPHTMHEPMAQQYVDVITEWIKTLS